MQVTKVTNNGRQIVIGKNHHVIVVGWTLTKKYVVNFAKKKKVQLVETSPIQNLLLLFYRLAHWLINRAPRPLWDLPFRPLSLIHCFTILGACQKAARKRMFSNLINISTTIYTVILIQDPYRGLCGRESFWLILSSSYCERSEQFRGIGGPVGHFPRTNKPNFAYQISNRAVVLYAICPWFLLLT